MSKDHMFTKKLLLGLAISGAVILAGTSPYFLINLIKGVSPKDLKKIRLQIAKAFYYLKKKKLIILKEEADGKIMVQLSEKGRKKILKYQLEDLRIETPIKWNKKWYVVIFDIPHKLRWARIAREAFRQKLKDLGFYQLQKSVWVHPYDCEKEILFLKEIFRLGPFVKYLEVTKIDDELKLREHFDLV